MLDDGRALHLPLAASAQQCAEQGIGRLTHQLREELPPQAVSAVVRKIRFGEPLDYDTEWKAFTTAYLLVNYRKMLAAARALPFGPTDVVVDAGCGTGAASLALLTVLAESGRQGDVAIELVDRSAPQLEAARALLHAVSRGLGLPTKLSVQQTDLGAYTPPGGASIVLLSHVLGEQPGQQADRILGHLSRALPANGALLAIEREDDQAWSKDAASRCDVTEGLFVAQAPVPLRPETDREWNTRWLLATRVPDWMIRLVDDYFATWREQDAGRLQALFAPEAIYHEKPFDEPLTGLGAIERYWQQHVVLQRFPEAYPTSIRYGVLSAMLEWRATFEVDGAGTEVRGQMQMDFDPHLRRITALREVFRTSPRSRRA